MSEKSDFFRFLRSLGAKEIAPGTKHRRWQIGNKTLPVPTNLSGARAFRNYEALARRMALEEGLIRPSKGRDEGSRHKEHAKSRPAPKPSPVRRVATGTREDLEEWNRREAEQWKSGYLKEALPMSETKPTREKMRSEERLPIVERILREADRPLTREDIRKIAGWPVSANQAIGRILATYPDRFRRTRGNVKRNERWELVTSRDTQAPSDHEMAPPAAAAPAEPAAEPQATTAGEEKILDAIQNLLDEFAHSGYNPNCAVYLLGRLDELMRQRPTSPAPS